MEQNCIQDLMCPLFLSFQSNFANLEHISGFTKIQIGSKLFDLEKRCQKEKFPIIILGTGLSFHESVHVVLIFQYLIKR